MEKNELKNIVLKQIRTVDPSIRVLLLSLTGSRGFGWANDRYDYDVHGIFVKNNYWDWVHLGLQGIDLNIWSLDHIFMDIYYGHFEKFQDLSNPIYIDPDYNHSEMISLCTPKMCDEYSILSEYKRFKLHSNPRSALHCYRIVMVRTYFLQTGNIEMNIFKLKEKFKVRNLDMLKKSYTEKIGIENYEPIYNELDELLQQFRKAKSKNPFVTKDWKERFTDWKQRMTKIFGGKMNE